MNILEEEFRLMDYIPRREAYISMLILGVGLGFLTACGVIGFVLAFLR